MWKNVSYSIWLSVFGALIGAIASAYVGTSITKGVSTINLFLLFSAIGAGIFFIISRLFMYFVIIIKYYRGLKKKADFYDQYHNNDSIRFLGPPYTNGIMGLSALQKKMIKTHLDIIRREFVPSRDEDALSTHGLVARYNEAYPEFPINGDTAEMLLQEQEREKIS